MPPARKAKTAAKKTKTSTSKGRKVAKAKPAKPAAAKGKAPKGAKGKASKAKATAPAKHEKAHCAAMDPFGAPCQSIPRYGSKYCTIHSYLDR
jgi:hypothetical protein